MASLLLTVSKRIERGAEVIEEEEEIEEGKKGTLNGKRELFRFEEYLRLLKVVRR